MKPLVLSFLLLCSLLSEGWAQGADSTRSGLQLTAGLGVATTYRYAFNRFDANGLVISLAPSYALSPRFSLALQGEYVLIRRFLTGSTEATSRRVTAPAIQAFSLGATYTLAKPDRPVQPFVGAGLGLYSLGTGTLEATQQEVVLGTRPGLSVRAGLKRGRMGLGVEAVLLDEGDTFNRDYVSVKYFYTFR